MADTVAVSASYKHSVKNLHLDLYGSCWWGKGAGRRLRARPPKKQLAIASYIMEWIEVTWSLHSAMHAFTNESEQVLIIAFIAH